MLFGAMNFPINPLLQEIDLYGKMGFDYLELAMDPPMAHHSLVISKKSEILRSLEQNRLGLICHLPTFVTTADLTPALRKASIEEMRCSLDTAAELGAKKVVLHPSMAWGMGAFVLAKVYQYAERFITEMSAFAADLGVTICLENMMPRNLLGVEPEYFEHVLRELPQLQLTLDTGHANMGSPDGKRLNEFIHRFGDRIGHIHVSDNGGVTDDHWAPGEGVVDFPKFIDALKKIGYDNTITLEVFDKNREKLINSRAFLEKLLKRNL